ncbi:MAG: PQQ-dependent sugar dehydrogenase [Bacteroidetes bacterium]|nr:PQQ-dependent sugar dehydrogenase [Bacteroidota bacterium]MBS1758243.1 PQQ-dependent sugar dehydrogenase [Bacteroidota bacterium]
MKNRLTYLALFFILLLPHLCFSQGEPFSPKLVLNQLPSNPSDRYYLQHPFGLLYGPDDSLWISERRGIVRKVDPVTGKQRVVLDIHANVKFTTSGSPVTSIKQDGMMGIALHPDYPAVDSFFVAYTYDAGGGVRKLRIARYPVKNTTITTRAGNETVIIQGLSSSTDHSCGRLIIGPDKKIYYAVGDQGANQFNLRCNPNRAQDVPTAAELTAQNYGAYEGKILRINMDGSIPTDNPVIKGIKSHIYSFGHRNPCGLVFAKDGNQKNYTGSKLYSAENGSAEDDEINQIMPGKNYGWPYIAGYQDNIDYQYRNWSSASNCNAAPAPSAEPECSTPPAGARIMNEMDTTLPDFQEPMRTFFTPTAALPCSWLSNPTVAPSSLTYYGFANKIPGWQNSVLMATLKEGTVFRLKLSADGNSFVNLANGFDTARYFREENRLRDIAIGKDGVTFYIITDSVGQTSGPTTGQQNVLNNRGSILVYKYIGTLLNIENTPPVPVTAPQPLVKIYPNPASKIIYVDTRRNVPKPVIYQIYDMTGRLSLSGKSSRDNFTIDVGRLSKGVYNIKLYSSENIQQYSQKIIIQ